MPLNEVMKISTMRRRYKDSDIAQRMANGTFWSLFGTAMAKFMVLLAGIVCARILGKDGYGELGMIRSTISTFITLGLAGLGLTATKFISEYRDKTPEKIPSIYLTTTWFSFALGIIVSALIIILAKYIAIETLESPFLENDLKWGGILVFFTILNGVQGGVLSGFEDFKSIALNTLYGSFAESVLMCLGAYLWGVTGAIIGYGFGYVVIYLFNKYSIKRILRTNNLKIHPSQFNRKDLSIIYKFSLPSALAALTVAPVFWIVKSMLVRSGGYGQLAEFEAADQWKIIILFVPSAISNVVLPILSSITRSREGDFWKVLKINIFLNAGITLILTLIVCLFSNYIMKLYGGDFRGNATIVILCLSTVFTSISTVVGLSISSRNKMWIGFGFNSFWALMTISFSYSFLSMEYGASGISLAILCSYGVHVIIQLIYLKHIIK